jgi:hypothetical protein
MIAELSILIPISLPIFPFDIERVLFDCSLAGVIWRVGADYDILIYYLRITILVSKNMLLRRYGNE